MLEKYYPEHAAEYAQKLGLCSAVEHKMLSAMIKNNLNTVTSTSVGRLFDAVSAALGIARISTFEGDAAMSLEFAARTWLKNNGGAIPDCQMDLTGETLPTDKLFIELIREHLNGVEVGYLAYKFHWFLSEMILESCKKVRAATDLNVCALSGGSFQNMLLLELCCNKLRENGFRVLTHSLVPANDGGISLGQALAGVYKLKNI
jgi:hydrogenase maturation protein HypF